MGKKTAGTDLEEEEVRDVVDLIHRAQEANKVADSCGNAKELSGSTSNARNLTN